ncbi:PREDICTED: uncharacterized protein LOC108749821 [Trachymyrmex septentrionalis]|uniref:uncharacterized protein LOC108749821 n=1 Tax=Trachymyrmex septentrionalis TaxID=34720 RepID=UPI00084F40CD|nr:PREDICTED: uncharacterized protein LOC108749821 [Trachymyrmex septentrionalis]
MGGSSSQQAEPEQEIAEEAELSNGNESTIKTVIAPPTFATKDEFVRIWFSWKNDFFVYLKNIDKAKDKKQMWGFMLLNRMGPVGQEIHRTFHFYGEDKNTLDIDILIKKFDLYCLYGDKKRGNEDIDKYIHELKSLAQNYIDPVGIMKEKIIQDMSTQQFTGKAALLIESKGEKLIPYLQSLNFYYIAMFWKQCEDLMINEEKIDKIPKNSVYAKSATTEFIPIEQNQNQCTTIWGHRCQLCFPKLCCVHCSKHYKQFNYYTDNYKDKYIYDCTKCGMSHIRSRCPAYGELCIKCNKKNHFSKMCRAPVIINCSKCGMNHVISKCPAYGQICRHCNKLNHLEEKCRSAKFKQIQSVY